MRSGFVCACIIAAVVPLLFQKATPQHDLSAFPGWPEEFEGRKLRRLSLTKRERAFTRGFAGQIARFSDGNREIIMRWIVSPTRKLHWAEVCFRGMGYSVRHLPQYRDAQGHTWTRFDARADAQSMRVRSRIFDTKGESWADISSWFWATVWKRTQGPWWAITVAESATSESGARGLVH